DLAEGREEGLEQGEVFAGQRAHAGAREEICPTRGQMGRQAAAARWPHCGARPRLAACFARAVLSAVPAPPALSPVRRTRLEVKALLALAGPIIVAQLANTAMGFVDTLMAGRVSSHDLAAVALGNSIWVPVLLLMNGILLATTA